MSLTDYLNESNPRLIVETGCLYRAPEHNDGWSTLEIARWCNSHMGMFHSIDIDQAHIDTARSVIRKEGFSLVPLFHLGDSVDVLKRFAGPVDFAYLDSCDGYEHGLAEFKECARLGAKMIVMDDYIGKAVEAAEYARSTDWDVRQEDRYTVMRR